MPDYAQWETRKLSVDALRLDKRNPRLAGDSLLDCNQNEIMTLLIEQSDVRDIAKRIQQNGYFSFVPPIVVKEGKYFVVIEGNRRVAALKLLRKPELSTVSTRRFYVGLSSEFDSKSIEKIDVVIAPCREDADIVLYTTHAAQASRPWSRVMKHRFIAGQISQGSSVSSIASKFNVVESEIKESVIEVLMLNLAKTMDFDIDTSVKILSENFPLSTLTRIVSTATFREMTDFSLDDSSFSTKLSEKQFRAFMKRIFLDLAMGVVNSRSLDDEVSRTNYLKVLQQEYIGEKEEGPWIYIPHSDEPVKNIVEPRPPRARRARQRLVPVADIGETGNFKLDALLAEGYLMPLGSYRNAGALLLRTILQLAVCRVIESYGKGCYIKKSNGTVKGLQELLEILTKNDIIPMSQAFRDQIKRLFSKDNSEFINIRTLHDYVHDLYQQPDKVALQNYWGIIEQIIAMIRKD